MVHTVWKRSPLACVKTTPPRSRRSIRMAVQRKVAELVASIPEINRWKVDREIDYENVDIRGRTVPMHLGRIAAEMTNWEDTIADLLELTGPDTADIMEKYSRKPSLQRYNL